MKIMDQEIHGNLEPTNHSMEIVPTVSEEPIGDEFLLVEKVSHDGLEHITYWIHIFFVGCSP